MKRKKKANKQEIRKLIEISPEEAQVLDLLDKNIILTILNMLKQSKEIIYKEIKETELYLTR